MGKISGEIKVDYSNMEKWISELNGIIEKEQDIINSIGIIEDRVLDESSRCMYHGQASAGLVEYVALLKKHHTDFLGYIQCCMEFIALCKETSIKEADNISADMNSMTDIAIEG